MKQNPSDMEANNNNNNRKDNCIDVDEIVLRIVVKIRPLLKNYVLDSMSKDVPKIEEHYPEQSRDDVSEIKVTMNEPMEIKELNPNSEQSRNVSLIKVTVPKLNPTVPLSTAQMLKRGRRNKILMKNGDNGVRVATNNLVAKKFVGIGKKGGNLFDWGLYKNDNRILPMLFYICSGFIWHPNVGVG